MFAFFKTLGLSTLILIITSFISVLVITDALILSIVTVIITYFLHGFIAASYSKFPYFFSYMTALILIVINFLFMALIMDINVLLNQNIVFYSLVTASSLSLVGAFVKVNILGRRIENV